MRKKNIAAVLLALILGVVNTFPVVVYAEDNLSESNAISDGVETESEPIDNIGANGLDDIEYIGKDEPVLTENAGSATEEVQEVSELNYPEGTTVYYNGKYYNTLTEALKAVCMDTESTGTKEVHCKAGADVGGMTHGHVADDLIIYGNGAYVSSGERDLEIDTYRYSRETGNQDNNGEFLEKDITVTVKDLNGIAAWGQRHTEHTITLNFENCHNMQRIYFTGITGVININADGCSFDSESATLKANKDTTIYSNANGSINVNNSTFNNIDVGFNLNHKMQGVQTISIVNTEFINCGQGTKTDQSDNTTYAAPVRIVAKEGAKSNLTVNNVKFTYDEGISNFGNGDILIGDGRHDASEIQGVTTLSMTDTKAKVMVQKAQYYGANGVIVPDKAVTTDVEVSDVILPTEDNHFEIDKHDNVKIENKKESSCAEEGYTGDKVCIKCDRVIEKGQSIAKLAHTYGTEFKTDTENHWNECSVCQEKGNVEKHVLKWMVDKEATHTENGLKHEECETCGYSKEGIEILSVGHTFSKEWKNDETKHWHQCECGEKSDVTKHTFKWVVDEESTEKEKGSKHEECSACGYKKTSVEIPALTPTEPEKPNTDKPEINEPNNDNPGSVKTGDRTSIGLYISLLAMSALGIAVLAIWKKKKSKSFD